MGRALKRVPIDFEWPMKQIWKGYINPFRSQKCNPCDGTGLNPATKKLSDDWYSFDQSEWLYLGDGRRYNNKAWQYHLIQEEVDALIEHGRLMEFTHTWKNGEGWRPKEPPYVPTAEEINRWSTTGMGHDSINQWICVESRARRFGVYGHCEFCKGEGEIWQTEDIKRFHEEWQPFEPPTGDGYQLWETTSEGSAISPVFATLDFLCIWAAENVSTFADAKATPEEWRKMLEEDFVHHTIGKAIFI